MSSTATINAPVVPAPGRFDLRDFVAQPRPMSLAAEHDPAPGTLPTPVLNVLDHVRRVEQSALNWMRDLLVTPTHADATVTAFLTTWAYERYWLGHTCSRILDHHGPLPAHRVGLPRRFGSALTDRFRPTIAAVGTNLLGQPVVAGHLAFGLADTFALRLTMLRLGELCPPLAPLSQAVAHSSARHVDFYTEQIRLRAAQDPGSHRFIRRALTTWRWPGSRSGDRRQIRSALMFLLRDPVCRRPVAQADAALRALPGAPARNVLRTEFASFVVHGPLGSDSAYSYRSVRP